VWISISVAGAIVLAYIVLFNALVAAKHKVMQAWSGIDVQLKRRYDLIPKLVDTVKAYAGYEQQLLEHVVRQRNQAISVPDGHTGEQGRAEGLLAATLRSIFALAEAYPDLKANQNYLDLQNEISETEDQIAAARRIFNSNVNELNVRINSFPSNLVAAVHRFEEAELFEIPAADVDAVAEGPDIKF